MNINRDNFMHTNTDRSLGQLPACGTDQYSKIDYYSHFSKGIYLGEKSINLTNPCTP